MKLEGQEVARWGLRFTRAGWGGNDGVTDLAWETITGAVSQEPLVFCGWTSSEAMKIHRILTDGRVVVIDAKRPGLFAASGESLLALGKGVRFDLRYGDLYWWAVNKQPGVLVFALGQTSGPQITVEVNIVGVPPAVYMPLHMLMKTFLNRIRPQQ